MDYKTSKAKRDANKRYDQNSVDRVLLRLPKGKKQAVIDHIETTADSSLNGFICRAIDETIERDKDQ